MRVTALLQAIGLCFFLVSGLIACEPRNPASVDGASGVPSTPAASESKDSATLPDIDADRQPAAALASDKSEAHTQTRARRPNERPLPGFSGRTLDGQTLSVSSLIGRRMLIFFFNPEEEGNTKVAQAIREVAAQQKSHNFRVLGVGIGSKPSQVRKFAEKNQLDFPIIDDSNGRISSQLGLKGTALILGADAEGYVAFVLPGFDTSAEDASATIANKVRESMRIPTLAHAGALIAHPQAPTFTTEYLNGEPFDFAELEGRPKIVMFFLHTCPHCHHALAFFKEELAKIPEDKRPALVAISLQNRPSAVRLALDEADLDFFTPLVDPGQEVAELYGPIAGVPDISLVNAEGEVIYQMRGWREDRDPALMRMYLNRIAGEPVPMLLSREGYSGNDVCAVCHEEQNATWEITRHAQAFDTLVTHGDERDGECVSCHVVGYDQPGGYSFSNPAPYLEGVGCETCHGRGGPHLSPEHLADGGYASVCVGCHDSKHSLGFDFATFLPGVSHAAIASLSNEERAARFTEGLSHRDLLPDNADYVGSDACQSCHATEYATWADSPHAHSLDSLSAKGQANEADCLRCHTTGYGRAGGFPEGGDPAIHADRAQVGCESCHGPGGNHVAEGARGIGTITSLGDKCDSCVILQICGGCHDSANDPDFEFSVQEHIERQRHGTIEAGTGKPIGQSAARSEAAQAAQIAWAFRNTAPSTTQGG
ncbi:MAG: multiheme c-type cytochrome [Myxococcota bacterium]|nr:multiheme c-type cytochrome [Myxococcota bacterium]